MRKYFKEMDMSNMPMSKNIEDRRGEKIDRSKADPAGMTPSSSRMQYGTQDRYANAALKPGLHQQTAIDSGKYKLARDPSSLDNHDLVRNVRENKVVPVIKTIKKIVKQARDKKKYK
jgi:hypothetical protein